MARIWCVYNRHNIICAKAVTEGQAEQYAVEMGAEYPLAAPYTVREEEGNDK